jgi:hypothetical protein
MQSFDAECFLNYTCVVTSGRMLIEDTDKNKLHYMQYLPEIYHRHTAHKCPRDLIFPAWSSSFSINVSWNFMSSQANKATDARIRRDTKSGHNLRWSTIDLCSCYPRSRSSFGWQMIKYIYDLCRRFYPKAIIYLTCDWREKAKSDQHKWLETHENNICSEGSSQG